jgi:hypothetical protein
MRGFLFYLLRPEPEPVGVSVEPLGEAGRDDVLHLAEQLIDAGAGFRKALAKRLPRGFEMIGHQERPIERAAAGLVKRAGRNPFHRVDHARARQDVVLGIARIMGIAGFVQRALDEEIAGLVARRCAADELLRSMISTLRPARARIAPAVRPPRPAPTTTMSYCAIQTQSPENPLISAVLAARAGHVKCAGRMAQVRQGQDEFPSGKGNGVGAAAVLCRLLLDRGLHPIGRERYGAQPHAGRIEHRIRKRGGDRRGRRLAGADRRLIGP